MSSSTFYKMKIMRLKSIAIACLCLMALAGCEDPFKTPAERAIEEQQNKVWLELLASGKDLSLRWHDLSMIKGDAFDKYTLSTFRVLINDYKGWREKVYQEGKISKIPKQIRKIIDDSDTDWKTIYETMKGENERLKAAAAQEESDKRIREESEAIANSEAQTRKKNLLAWSVEQSNREQLEYETKHNAWKRQFGNTVTLLSDASGSSMTWGYSSPNQFKPKLRIQNMGLRGGQSSNVEQVYLDFTVTELPMDGSCGLYPSGPSYHYRIVLPLLIYPNQIKDIEVPLPKFFERVCVWIKAEG